MGLFSQRRGQEGVKRKSRRSENRKPIFSPTHNSTLPRLYNLLWLASLLSSESFYFFFMQPSKDQTEFTSPQPVTTSSPQNRYVPIIQRNLFISSYLVYRSRHLPAFSLQPPSQSASSSPVGITQPSMDRTVVTNPQPLSPSSPQNRYVSIIQSNIQFIYCSPF